MKNCALLKFLAILLCAACLLSAAVSGVAIGCLVFQELYSQTPEEMFAANQYYDFRWQARKLAMQYEAALHSNAEDWELDKYFSDYYTPVDSTFMTTGEIAPVAGTPMDFTAFKEIGKEINNYDFDQLKNGNGYDHNWVLNTKGDDTKVCATLKSPVTGIVLDVYTNEPGIQIYTGNFLDGTTNGKDGKSINQRTAICLETQKYPDTPNKSHLEGWPSATLEPGQKYYSHCVYKFSVQK